MVEFKRTSVDIIHEYKHIKDISFQSFFNFKPAISDSCNMLLTFANSFRPIIRIQPVWHYDSAPERFVLEKYTADDK